MKPSWKENTVEDWARKKMVLRLKIEFATPDGIVCVSIFSRE